MTNDTNEKRRWLRALSELEQPTRTRIEGDTEHIEKDAIQRNVALDRPIGATKGERPDIKT
jgi:hypothetical protein